MAISSGTRGGYLKVYETINECFNVAFALLFLLLSLPVFVLIALAIKLTDNGPVFYRGVRLGRNKEQFTMYKFRTLVTDAEQIVGPELLSPSHKLETKIGKLLRETRLDELPQLYNVLKGDMDFVGPRPERPAVYEKICRHIKNYDVRFTVKPGLIGYAQLFTPHSAPKEIRTLIDNRFVRFKQNFAIDLFIILCTVITVGKKAHKRTGSFLWKLAKIRLLGNFEEKRTFERVRRQKAHAVIYGGEGDGKDLGPIDLIDINEEAFLIKVEHPLALRDFSLILQTEYRQSGRRGIKKRIAQCKGHIYKEGRDDALYLYVIKYTPETPLNFYIVHQYFLEKSIA